MRNVTRLPKPPSLRKNAAKWKRELLSALAAKKIDRRRLDRLFSRYNCDDVRDALDQMYEHLCCYCEAFIGAVAFEHIEHRRPKAEFPAHTFEWDNLHLGCPICNQAKGNKWNRTAQILDSTAADQIEDHLTYKLRDALGCARWPISQRGRTTIDHANLNRPKLCRVRTQVAHGVLGLIGEINGAPSSPSVSVIRRELSEKTAGQFGSLVKWLMDTYLKAA